APERFEIIGVNLAANILALSVTHCFVREVFFQESITGVLTGRDQIDLFTDCFSNKGIKRDGIGILDYLTNDIALSADRADNSYLAALLTARYMSFLVRMAVLILSANKGFVNFDNAHKLLEVRIVPGGAQTIVDVRSMT